MLASRMRSIVTISKEKIIEMVMDLVVERMTKTILSAEDIHLGSK